LQETAQAIAAHLPPGTAFLLLACDFGGKPGESRLEYIANMQREDAVKLLTEFLKKATGSDWCKHTGLDPLAPGEETPP
jgi:hypothetical protein